MSDIVNDLIITISEPSSNYDNINDSIAVKLIFIKKLLDSSEELRKATSDELDELILDKEKINKAFM